MNDKVISDTPEQAEFRAHCREWLSKNRPAPFKGPVQTQEHPRINSPEHFQWLRDWQKAAYDGGLVGCDYPKEYGGGGHTDCQRIANQEMTWAKMPGLIGKQGLSLVSPTLIDNGSEFLKKRFIPKALSGEEIWCQGFSEPGSGSDLASLQCRAERHGDGYLVTGHKVWTTVAQYAKWMILLARSDFESGKYQGLSYFLCPMDVEGISVQPLVKMSGEGGFNQVIFDHAPMPADSLLGHEGEGWKIAMTTLTFERGASEGTGAGGAALGGTGFVRQVADLARRVERDGRPAAADPVLRDRLAGLWIQEEALRLA
ncbi:MAG: acyl-CoA dehydrogenase family protein, partial [Desulfobacterales bacterium]